MLFKSGFKGSLSLSQISLSTVWTCQCVYAIPTMFVGTFLLFVRQKAWYKFVNPVRYIDFAVLVQLFYNFFNDISEIYLLLVLVSFLFILFSFVLLCLLSLWLTWSKMYKLKWLLKTTVEIICILISLSCGSRAYVHKRVLRNLIAANLWSIEWDVS